jgi:probable rRNA maturation factor
VEINVLIDDGLEEHLDVGRLQRIGEQILTLVEADPQAELSLVITSQERVRELNRNYLGRDVPTDVLAFPMLAADEEPASFIPPPDGIRHLGEVIISYPQAVIQAGEQGHSTDKEIAILVIHGVLHLLGYGDETPELKKQMQAREQEILSRIGID